MLPIAADDPDYQGAALAEAEFWGGPDTLNIADGIVRARTGPIKRHYNRRFTGHPDVPWYETIARHGPFQRGLVLGCGGLALEERILRSNPSARFTICDIDAAGLRTRASRFGALFPGRVSTRVEDLNFAVFQPDAYDLIVSANTIHHIVDLEHLAGAVARALAPGGQFFLYDYTGPSGFRVPSEQRCIFELIHERERRRNNRLPPIRWRDVDSFDYSPFEAVRSADTRGVLQSNLKEVEARGAGAIIGLLMFSGITDEAPRPVSTAPPLDRLRARLGRSGPETLIWERMLSKRCLRELAFVDDVIVDAAVFPANHTFARYARR